MMSNSDQIAEPAPAETFAPSFKDNLVKQSFRERCDNVFFVALNLKSPTKRKRFLERACAKDARLRRAVEEHVAIYAEADRFFEELSSALGLDEDWLHRK